MGASRMKFLRSLLPAIALLGVGAAHAQNYDWSVELSSGERYTNVELTRITSDSLILTLETTYTEWITLDSVYEVRRERRDAVLPATVLGAVAGAAIGYAMKPTSVQQGEANLYSMIFGMVIGGVGGFVLGSHLLADEVVDLRRLDRAAKFESLSNRLKEAQ